MHCSSEKENKARNQFHVHVDGSKRSLVVVEGTRKRKIRFEDEGIKWIGSYAIVFVGEGIFFFVFQFLSMHLLD